MYLDFPTQLLAVDGSLPLPFFRVPFPCPWRQGRRDSQFRIMPELEIRMLRKGNPGHGGNFYEGSSARVAARPALPHPRVSFFGTTVTSQPWIQLTGGYDRGLSCYSAMSHVQVGAGRSGLGRQGDGREAR